MLTSFFAAAAQLFILLILIRNAGALLLSLGIRNNGYQTDLCLSIVIWEAAAQDSQKTLLLSFFPFEKRQLEMFYGLVETESCPSTCVIHFPPIEPQGRRQAKCLAP